MTVEEIKEKINGSQFQTDLNQPLSINAVTASLGYYNLIVSIRDVKMYSVKIKPHRYWNLKMVKNYFNVTGDTIKVLAQLEAIKNVVNQL